MVFSKQHHKGELLNRIYEKTDWSMRLCSMMHMDSKKFFLRLGYTDLRRGIEGLAAIISFQFELDSYDKNTLFLFCGKRSDRIKGLLWEGDGFLLLYKRLDNGAFNWPRTESQAMEIT